MKKKDTLRGWGILIGTAVVFIVLKVTGITSWGWGWVLSPIWLPFAFTVVAVLLTLPVLVWQMVKEIWREHDRGEL